MKIKALAHVCIFSRDLARTEAFYCGVLGLSIQFRFMRKGELFGYYLKISDSQFIEVFTRSEEATGDHAQIGHICLETDDVMAMRDHLQRHHVTTTEPTMGGDHSWQVWCHDPDGTPIEFHQYTPQSTQYTGGDCNVDWC